MPDPETGMSPPLMAPGCGSEGASQSFGNHQSTDRKQVRRSELQGLGSSAIRAVRLPTVHRTSDAPKIQSQPHLFREIEHHACEEGPDSYAGADSGNGWVVREIVNPTSPVGASAIACASRMKRSSLSGSAVFKPSHRLQRVALLRGSSVRERAPATGRARSARRS